MAVKEVWTRGKGGLAFGSAIVGGERERDRERVRVLWFGWGWRSRAEMSEPRDGV